MRLFSRYEVERIPASPDASMRYVKDVVPVSGYLDGFGLCVHVADIGLVGSVSEN
jgi:hypothetical protein